VNRVAEYLGVGQPTASHLVDKIVRQGFADRSESPTDRRVTLVRLTPKGEDLVRRLYQGGEDQYRAWVRELTDEERKKLLSGLQALVRRRRHRSPCGLHAGFRRLEALLSGEQVGEPHGSCSPRLLS